MDIQIIASGSSGNAYRISDGKTALLLDAGIPFKQLQKALNFKVSQLDGCLVSHCHGDHTKACKELLRAGIDIYTSEGTIAACGLSGRHVKAVKSLISVEVGSFEILPFGVEHDAPEPLGFLIFSKCAAEKLLYFTDTYYLKYRFKGLNYIMGECNYSQKILEDNIKRGTVPVSLAKRIIKSHMSFEHFVDFLQANDLSQVRQIYLLHMSNDNGNADYFKKEVQKITGAEVYVC